MKGEKEVASPWVVQKYCMSIFTRKRNVMSSLQ